jgi:MFS family permease
MKQRYKFYLASFLKNQTYFVPIIVLFFQDLGLSYSEIFWIFTIGSAFAFLIEIPTGMIADLFGNRRSIIVSKFLIFLSFIFFGFASGFITLLLANLLYELGKSFRSGTETAFVFNYLDETKDKEDNPKYTKIKINQKFFARVSEALAALLGGFIANQYGFSWVFYIAAIPALVNFIQTLTWSRLSYEERQKTEMPSFSKQYLFIKKAVKEVYQNKSILNLVLNISLFATAFAALDKFIQPYMKMSGLDLQYFGMVYSVFLIIVAFLTKFASRIEDKIGGVKLMNYTSYAALIPLLILSLKLENYWSIGLFFIVLMIDNLRSPIANNLFHEQVKKENRATMGSILELFKSVNKLWFLPVIGYMADMYNMYVAILIISALILFNAIFFKVKKKEVKTINSSQV